MKPIFISDADQARFSALKASSKGYSSSVRILEAGKLAFNFLSQPNETFSAIFLPTFSVNPGVIEFIQHARSYHPVTPIYLIRENGFTLPEEELNRLGVVDFVEPSLSVDAFLGKVTQFSPEEYEGRKFEFSIPQSVLNQKKYIPISIEQFTPNGKVFFDIYVHQVADRFQCIHSAFEVFSDTKLRGLIKKGVSHLYVNQESMQRNLIYCRDLANRFLDNEKISTEMKFLNAVSLQPELVATLKAPTADGFCLDPVELYVENTFQWIMGSKADTQSIIRTYLKSMHLLEHVTAVNVMTALLAQALKIQSADSLRKLGVASLLHDIGLNTIPQELHHEVRENMSEEDRKVFEEHPTKGAAMLKAAGVEDPLILQIVAQHHERRNEWGFPYRKSPGEINLFSEIVGIADDYVIYRTRFPQATEEDLREYFESYIFDGFSPTLVNAARLVFIEWVRDSLKAGNSN